jgi:growth hormone-inducible transmembrane protein
MSLTLTVRQGPARLATRLPELTKPAFRGSAPARAFHKTSTKSSNFFASRTASSSSIFRSAPRNVFQQARSYQYQSGAQAADTSSIGRRLLTGGAIFGGTLIAMNVMFNRETREDGGMPLFERSYLNQTFMHTGLGIGIIGLTARQMVQSGFVYRLMVTNPWVVAIGGLAASFGTMIGTRMIEPDK